MRKVLVPLLVIVNVIIGIKTIVFADITIESGETFALSANETINIDESLTIQPMAVLDTSASLTSIILNGNWTNSGTFIPGDGTDL